MKFILAFMAKKKKTLPVWLKADLWGKYPGDPTVSLQQEYRKVRVREGCSGRNRDQRKSYTLKTEEGAISQGM